jgi:hypothetical protein
VEEEVEEGEETWSGCALVARRLLLRVLGFCPGTCCSTPSFISKERADRSGVSVGMRRRGPVGSKPLAVSLEG